jgi:hypothetical protein
VSLKLYNGLVGGYEMKELTPDKILAFAKTLEGQELETLWRKAQFTITVAQEEIRVVPASHAPEQKPLIISRTQLNWACEEYERSKSLRPADYGDKIGVSSYVVTIIALMLNREPQ